MEIYEVAAAVDAALAEGRFSPEQRDFLLELGRTNPGSLRSLINCTPPVTLSEIERDVARASGMSPKKMLEAKIRCIVEGRMPRS